MMFPYADEPPMAYRRVYGSRCGKVEHHDQVIAKVIFASPPNETPLVRVTLHPCVDAMGPPVDRHLTDKCSTSCAA